MPFAHDTDLLDGLVPQQVEAVAHVDGPLLVLAGPGSGKTTVVTRRVAYLVGHGVPPWQILALTFTNKAAGEMRDRIERLLPDGLPGRRGLTVSTFHSFSARLLRRYAVDAGLSPGYSIYDSADQRDAIRRALQKAQLSTRNWPPASVAAAISNAKNRLLNATEFAAEATDFYARSLARAYEAYEKILRDADALDFDDLLLSTARLLRNSEPVRRELQDRYRYLLIDEYQDTNHAQFVIAHTLAAAHGNVCVVGDPDQSIYGWRGADIRNILEFEQHHPDARVIPLGENFRSTGHIVEAAAALIGHNRHRRDKKLYTSLEDGEKPAVVTVRDEHDEARLVADELRRRHDDEDVAWKDMAVLYRVNALSRVLEEAFRTARIPYVIARGTAFYERKEVKDALAYMRLVVNPADEVALRRIVNTPTRGIGKTTLEKVELFAIDRQLGMLDALRRAEEVPGLAPRAAAAVRRFVEMVDGWRASLGPGDELLPVTPPALPDLVERIIRDSGLERFYGQSKLEEDVERLENLGELISAAAGFELLPDDDGSDADVAGVTPPSTDQLVVAFLESIALVSDADAVDPDAGAVTLMTLHTAKGLEFDVVVMVGLEDGLLPHSRSTSDEHSLEEERRLCFVGMTRARRHLLMTRATVRTQRGIRERTIESQFLRELPEDVVTRLDQAGSDFVDPWPDDFGDGPSGSPAYGGRGGVDDRIGVGVTVRHPMFGIGRIQSITRRPAGSSARVEFRQGGTKTLILEYAKLEVEEAVDEF